jgi:hypothetical protein
MKNPSVLSLGFLLGAALIGVQAADIREGLVAHWPLDANDGGTAVDNGLGNTMFVTNSPAVNPGQFNNAFTLDGSTTFLLAPHLPDNTINGLPIYRAGRYTVTLWVKGVPQVNKYLFTEGATNSGTPLFVLQTGNGTGNNSSKLDVIIRTDGNGLLINHVVSTNVVLDNTWHHIAWVDDRGSVKVYIDGNLDAANFNYVPSGAFTFHTTVIGSLVRTTVATTGIFNGQIDDVAAWERPLTQAEVQQVMASSLPSTPPFITLQPVGGLRSVADRITFRSRAVGSPALAYQWLHGETEIPGAIGRTLALSNLSLADAGDYTLRVSHPEGSVNSDVATLTVVVDPPPDVRQSLVSHWPFNLVEVDELGQENTPDLYSNNDMAMFHPLSFLDQVPGAFDNAILFNGVDQYGVRQGGFPIYDNSAYSVAMWIMATGIGQSDLRFFSESSTNVGAGNQLFCFGTHATGADGTMRVFIRNNAGAAIMVRNSTQTVLDGTWHHIVWTETNGLARLYVDGVLDATDFDYTRSPLTLNQTSVGAIVRAAIGSYFAGALDEVAVWNRALTRAEIQEVRMTGIPPPTGAIAPAVTRSPVSQSVLTRSRVTFDYVATGTSPLTTQWQKDGEDIPGETGTTLRIGSAALADAGEYTVVVSNSAGSATSDPATLTVTQRPPSPSELKIDFNNTDQPSETELGFQSFALTGAGVGPFSKTFGGADLTVTGAGGIGLQSRRRVVPVNSGVFTEAQLLLDFIFASDTNTSQGMDLDVEFLEPNAPFTVSIWSYDNGSSGSDRISDWSANGAPVRTGYSFFGTTLPTDNDTYRFDFNTISDANGRILIEGRRSAFAAGNLNVFVNALKVARRQLRVKKLRFLDFDISLTIELLDPAATHRIEEKINLNDPEWTEVADAFYSPPVGNSQEVIFPITAPEARFFRVVEVH